MTVLVEGISVIIKLEAIERVIPNGWEGFREHMPNFTLCKDDKLARFCFLSEEDVIGFKEKLEKLNFVYQGSDGAQDFVLVDQVYGPTTKSAWLEYGHLHIDKDENMKVAACRVTGTQDDTIVTPDGWTYENSLTAQYGLEPAEQKKSGN